MRPAFRKKNDPDHSSGFVSWHGKEVVRTSSAASGMLTENRLPDLPAKTGIKGNE